MQTETPKPAKTAAPKKPRRYNQPRRDQLTEHEKRFCEYYVIELNASYAYGKAWPDRIVGKSRQHVAVLACQMVAKPKIQAHIVQVRQQFARVAERKFDITSESILQRLAAIANASLEEIVDFDDEGQPYIDLKRADRVAMRGFNSIKIKRVERVQDDDDDDADDADDDNGDGASCDVPAPSKKKGKLILSSTEVKLPDRVAALTKLGQHLNLFKDSDGTVNVTVDLGDVMNKALERAKAKRAAAT